MSRSLTYIGPIDEVEVPFADGSYVLCARNESADFADDVAASLLEQPSNWAATTSASAASSPAPAPAPADASTNPAPADPGASTAPADNPAQGS